MIVGVTPIISASATLVLPYCVMCTLFQFGYIEVMFELKSTWSISNEYMHVLAKEVGQ